MCQVSVGGGGETIARWRVIGTDMEVEANHALATFRGRERTLARAVLAVVALV